jgi:hypothetical protein
MNCLSLLEAWLIGTQCLMLWLLIDGDELPSPDEWVVLVTVSLLWPFVITLGAMASIAHRD